MPTDSHRLFFALFPPPAVRDALAQLQRKLSAPARAVKPRQFHVTLAFLGAVPGSGLERLGPLADAMPFAPVSLHLDRAGWFPRARVGWVGSTAVPPPLLAFRGALNAALGEAGFRAESRPWAPHVTLYREMRKPFATVDLRPIDWPVDCFSLVASETRPEGVRYRVLQRWDGRRRRISDH